MFAGRRSCIEWQAIPQQRNWAKSTKLAQTSTWAHLTNTGKVLAWPGIEPGTFFCHGRCSNHWATAPCPEILSILADDPYTSYNFPCILYRVPWHPPIQVLRLIMLRNFSWLCPITLLEEWPTFQCYNTCQKLEWVFHSFLNQNKLKSKNHWCLWVTCLLTIIKSNIITMCKKYFSE